MANVTITEAARLAGISRQYLYTKYIKPGVLTVKKDDNDKPCIDTAELMRVFSGRLPGPKGQSTPDTSSDIQALQNMTRENDIKNAALQAEVEALRESIKAADKRETWLQGKVDELTGQLAVAHKLLEHKAIVAADPPPAPDPPQEPKRGFFGRLFGRK